MLQPENQAWEFKETKCVDGSCICSFQPYSLGNYYWIMSHILALAGAFLACLGAARWDLDVRRQDHSATGLANWVVSGRWMSWWHGPLIDVLPNKSGN